MSNQDVVAHYINYAENHDLIINLLCREDYLKMNAWNFLINSFKRRESKINKRERWQSWLNATASKVVVSFWRNQGFESLPLRTKNGSSSDDPFLYRCYTLGHNLYADFHRVHYKVPSRASQAFYNGCELLHWIPYDDVGKTIAFPSLQ